MVYGSSAPRGRRHLTIYPLPLKGERRGDWNGGQPAGVEPECHGHLARPARWSGLFVRQGERQQRGHGRRGASSSSQTKIRAWAIRTALAGPHTVFVSLVPPAALSLYQDAYFFLQSLFAAHPQYAGLPFYVFGESFGGHYAPGVAHAIYTLNAEAQVTS